LNLGDLLPLLTGGGGAIVALTLGYVLLLTGKLVTGREHDRLLEDYQKVTQANDTLTSSLQACRDNNAQLLNSSQLTTRLLDTLAVMADQRAKKGGG
jgi:hypothetical protein